MGGYRLNFKGGGKQHLLDQYLYARMHTTKERKYSETEVVKKIVVKYPIKCFGVWK